MALDALELGVIAVMGIAIFIWGPEKVPQIARQLGQVRREVETATKQLQGMSKELQQQVGGSGQGGLGSLDSLLNLIPGVSDATSGTGPAAGTAQGEPTTPAPNIVAPPMVTPASGVVSGDRLLIDMARKLGIPTSGKTREAIQNEIVARASQHPAPNQATPAPAQSPEVAAPTVEQQQAPPQPPSEAPQKQQQPPA